jgi:hypothetical protein
VHAQPAAARPLCPSRWQAIDFFFFFFFFASAAARQRQFKNKFDYQDI